MQMLMPGPSNRESLKPTGFITSNPNGLGPYPVGSFGVRRYQNRTQTIQRATTPSASSTCYSTRPGRCELLTNNVCVLTSRTTGHIPLAANGDSRQTHSTLRPLVTDDSIVDHPHRLRQTIEGSLADRKPDAALQRIVRDAATKTGFPIALVSLVRRRTQFFRAHVGLPADLHAAGATDRCVSFCQFAVTRGEPLVIADTNDHPELPQELILSHSVRAYAGYPVRIAGHVVGTLCVLDTKAHQLSDVKLDELKSLAREAEARLAELASESICNEEAQSLALKPAFAEANNLLTGLLGATHFAKCAMSELEPLFAQLEAVHAKRLTPDDLIRCIPLLAESSGARHDLEGALNDLSRCAKSLASCLDGMRQLLLPPMPAPESVDSCIEVASSVSHHATKIVGGVRWGAAESDLMLQGDDCRPALVLSAALTLVAGALVGSTDGIDAGIRSDSARVQITLDAPQLSSQAAGRVASSLAMMVTNRVNIESNDTQIRLAFTRAIGTDSQRAPEARSR